MKKQPFFLLLFVFTSFGGLSQKSLVPQGRPNLDTTIIKDTLNVSLVHHTTTKPVIVLDSVSTLQLLQNAGKPSGYDKFSFWIQVLAILAAFAASIIAWRTFRRDKSYRDQTFITDFNKMMIEHPELRSFKPSDNCSYNSSVELKTPAVMHLTGMETIFFKGEHSFVINANAQESVEVSSYGQVLEVVKPGETRSFELKMDREYCIKNKSVIDIISEGKVIFQSLEDKFLEAKVEAYCHYKLNNFELVFSSKSNKGNTVAWENYFRKTYNESEKFRETVDFAIGRDAGIYSPKFIKRIKKILINQ